jgi:hypothetical protein
MPPVGGSVISVSIGGRQFAVPADAAITIKVGGNENELPSNGDGTSRLIKTRVPGMLTGIVLSIDDSQQDFEYLQSVADSNVLTTIVAELASGAIWTGNGIIVGELPTDTQATTATFDFHCEGALVQQ